MTRLFRFIFLIVILFTSGCSTTPAKKYRIAVDMSWYSLDTMEKGQNINGLTREILEKMAILENMNIELIPVNWDYLMEGLMKKNYDAILTSLPPLVIYQDLYLFSDLYLSTGPCVVLRLDESIKTLNDLNGKEIAIQQGDLQSMQVLQRIPNILIRNYDMLPKALNATVNEQIDGVCFSAIGAWSYCRDLYKDSLHVVIGPLNDAGLRMVVVKDGNRDLIKKFNRTIKELQSTDEYNALLEKWSLGPKG